MLKEIPITAARHELTSLPERLAKEPGAVAVTRRGKPVLAIMPWELYESIVETLEIMGDPELMAAIRQGIKDIEEGKTIPWETVKAELGL
ncbi:MAG: type II toxin-antitoxin system Phd/YefM family antitoxin [Deinococcus sp.]|nr:type II toxin-antitoxin system Phd/YefM family antitoxin [Deinococcus sp.]